MYAAGRRPAPAGAVLSRLARRSAQVSETQTPSYLVSIPSCLDTGKGAGLALLGRSGASGRRLSPLRRATQSRRRGSLPIKHWQLGKLIRACASRGVAGGPIRGGHSLPLRAEAAKADDASESRVPARTSPKLGPIRPILPPEPGSGP
jgi:hypothetical protein